MKIKVTGNCEQYIKALNKKYKSFKKDNITLKEVGNE